ncbi:MAG: tyrosine/phenylalanine carboxypeptidase domain-containing protein [Patescibacteria group bacterium]
MDTIQEYFDTHNMPEIPISLESSNLSRMSVAYGKEVKIRLSKNAVFREKEMQATLSHEIGTHLLRYLNGKSL